MLIGNNLPIHVNYKGSLLEMMPKPTAEQQPAKNQTQNMNIYLPTGYAPVATPMADELKKRTMPTLLAGMMANITKDYQTEKAQKVPSELQTPKLAGYKNNLRSMFQNNQAVIYAMVPRTFNAKDKNGNRLIEEELGEEKGTFINMIERLDELKSYGINTLHWLPINPPGKIAAKGSAGSVYAPMDYLSIDPALDDPNNPKSVYEEAKEAINECHKRGIKVMVDLPSCMSVDLYDERPDLRAEDAQGNPKTPEGWEDIRMFGPWVDADKRILNPELMKYHKDYIDMCLDLGIDGIRADVARAKPVEFWDELISYARSKDPEFGFLAETYVYEDASPMKNMPADRPEELLESGFDTYYGQYHIFPTWKAKDFHQFIKDNLKMSHKYDKGKSLIGSFATHDDKSPMSNGGPDYCMMTTVLQSTLPMTNPYMISGFESGDEYIYPYGNKYVNKTFKELLQNPVYQDTIRAVLTSKATPYGKQLKKLLDSEDVNLKVAELAQNPEYSDIIDYLSNFILTKDNIKHYVHTEFLDIFNESAKPEGNYPQIGEHCGKMQKLRIKYQDVITQGDYIELPVKNNKLDDVIAYARYKNGKALVVIANKNVNARQTVTVKVPGLKSNQVLNDIAPSYGTQSYYKAKDGEIRINLGKAKAHVFELDIPHFESYFKPSEIYKQNL